LAKIIAIDYGRKRIGLAIGERITGLALPWKIVPAKDDIPADAEAVWRELSDSGETIETIVVGLPLNMDDTEGPQARLSRQFGHVLAEESGIDVKFIDERLSSFDAEQRFKSAEKPQPGRRNKSSKPRKPLDAVAAAIILEDYLRSL